MIEMAWKNVPLKSKLVFFILVGILVVLITTTAVIISTVTAQEEELAYQQSIEKTKNYANKFDAEMRSNQATGQAIAHSLTQYHSENRTEVNNILLKLLEKNPDLLGTYVCFEPNAFDGRDSSYANTTGHDETGRFIPYWNRISGNITLDPLLDYETSGYYQLPKKLKRDIVTEPYYYEGVFIVSYVTPIIREGEFIGIGGVDVSLNHLNGVVNKVKSFDTGYAIMTGNTGILISHPTNEELVGAKTLYDYGVPEITRMADEIKLGKSGYIETIDPITGKDSVMFYEPIRTSNFAFILVVPRDEMLAGVTDLRNRLLLISSISLIFMGAVAILITRSVTGPINEIVNDFKNISDAAIGGKLDERAETDVDIDFREIPQGLNDILNALENASQLREEMEKVVNNSPVIVFKWKAEKNWPVEVVSKNISQFGYSPEDFGPNGLDYGDIVHPDDLPEVETKLGEICASQETQFNIEYRILTKDGETRWVDERTFIQREQHEIIHNMINKDNDIYSQVSDLKGKCQDVKYLQGVIVNIDERKQAEEALLKIEDIRKKEIHHRIKNNLQVISTLLYLESEKFRDDDVLDAFNNSRDRVRTMALVHEKLYQSKDMESIDFADYSKNLINYLSQSYVLDKSEVDIKINVENIFLGMDTAVPLGIIINELVSNSLKYAFDKGKGTIIIELRKINDHHKLVVSDNGIGMKDEIDFEETDSLGLLLVHTLAEQINATIEIDTSQGTRFEIIFQENNQEITEGEDVR
ncbi:histidine kinase dimerization/phosphoacceptor domain -containing protein [Methanohalophilus euhalobius]|uniref:Histidine kinase n=1 Tax=Methanohalophilus euhalobius TaxID=51203 RepID=A0A314ZSB5_9EURY|nr:histidine kinase dimerization/phosphoacceptor domain -containing protein [Methanohalophilus euhalobius]PQV41873.1 two-component sensor histidine kinase [Methanohalophilus euhalobius]RNI11415.1 histidine kinase [Methanohalophilus euhalobius]